MLILVLCKQRSNTSEPLERTEENQEQQHQQLRDFLEGYSFDQSQRPKRGDVVSYFDKDFWTFGLPVPKEQALDEVNLDPSDQHQDEVGPYLEENCLDSIILPSRDV